MTFLLLVMVQGFVIDSKHKAILEPWVTTAYSESSIDLFFSSFQVWPTGLNFLGALFTLKVDARLKSFSAVVWLAEGWWSLSPSRWWSLTARHPSHGRLSWNCSWFVTSVHANVVLQDPRILTCWVWFCQHFCRASKFESFLLLLLLATAPPIYSLQL